MEKDNTEAAFSVSDVADNGRVLPSLTKWLLTLMCSGLNSR